MVHLYTRLHSIADPPHLVTPALGAFSHWTGTLWSSHAINNHNGGRTQVSSMSVNHEKKSLDMNLSTILSIGFTDDYQFLNCALIEKICLLIDLECYEKAFTLFYYLITLCCQTMSYILYTCIIT